MQMRVIKSDGAVEEYLHTKVIGTLNNALALVNESNVYAAEQFSEAITFYLYRKNQDDHVASDQIHLMVQAILSATGYDHAARALNEYHLNRMLKRRRTSVTWQGEDQVRPDEPWAKSRIVEDLMARQGLSRPLARAIASAVEEKALQLGISRIRNTLIRELVASESDAMLRAGQQLQMAVE
ncbi:MAG: hypothetical protein JW828_04875 [Sedimentisphaerales bacterium]|nr:hypothetical protein [Sedimentisphaerales bacterium]